MAKEKSGGDKAASEKSGTEKATAPKAAEQKSGTEKSGGAKATAAKSASGATGGAAKGKSGAKADAQDQGEKKGAKSITKAQFIQLIGEKADLEKRQVTAVLDAINQVIVDELSSKGPGVVAMPGLFKLKAKRVEAVKGGKEVPNRFKKGEMTLTKDKPAHTKVSVRPLKGLKEMLK